MLYAPRPQRHALQRTAWVLLSAGMVALAGCGGGGGGGATARASSQTPLTPTTATTALDVFPRVSDQSVNLVADAYMPMQQGNVWVYDSTVDGDTTVGGVTRLVQSGPDDAGQVLVQEIEDQDVTQEPYVVAADGITELAPSNLATLSTGLARDWQRWLAYPNAALTPGQSRTMDRAGDIGGDYDGDGKNDDYRLHVIQTFVGLKAVPVLGQTTQVAQLKTWYIFEVTYSADHTTRTITITDDVALVPHLGMVQEEYLVMLADGTRIDHQLLALRAAHVGGVDHAVTSVVLDQTGISRIVPTRGDFSTTDATHQAAVVLTLDRPGATVQATSTLNALTGVTTEVIDATHVRATMTFSSANDLSGTYNDTLTLKVCLDRACQLQAVGSPYAVPVTAIYGRTQAPEAGLTLLNPVRQQLLGHDVVAARYSRALDRLVVVASVPQPALHLINPADGSALSLALSRVPTALALSPDGQQAAVGHDGHVTWVDLSTVGAEAPHTRDLVVSAKVHALTLNGDGVHVVPDGSSWSPLHTARVSTQQETLSGGLDFSWYLNAQSDVVERPDGRALYTFDTLNSPSFPQRWLPDANGVPQWDFNPVFILQGHDFCSGLWLNNDASQLLNGCGVLLHSAPQDPSVDLHYSATLPLTRQGQGNAVEHRLMHADASPLDGSWATLEYSWYNCLVMQAGGGTMCYHHLRTYASDSLAATGTWGLPPVALGGTAYDQDGVATFFDRTGQHLYVLTHVRGAPSATAAYLLEQVR